MARPIKNRKLKPIKIKKRVYRGIVHIQAGSHNTFVTMTNIRGDVFCWASSGSCGFKGKRKATGFAAKKAGEAAAKKARDLYMKEAKVLVIGPGQGRENAIREIFKAGIKVSIIRDNTSLPHNGCRPPKKRRI